MESSLRMRLSVLGLACTAVVLVGASVRLDYKGCYFFMQYNSANDLFNYVQGGVLFSKGEEKHIGVLVSPKHVLVKTPDDKSFNISTADVTLGMKRLSQTGTMLVLKSTTCGSYTVATLRTGWRTDWAVWNCLASSWVGDPLPLGANYLFGSDPKTLYAEVTKIGTDHGSQQRTCGKNGMVEKVVGHVTEGPLRFDTNSKDTGKNYSRDLSPVKFATPNFIINVPNHHVKHTIYGYFDKWIGGGGSKGPFKFTFTRFNDKDVNCIKDVVYEKQP